MATFLNDLRLTELSTGEGSGSWGTTTNQSLELIGEALGYATQQVFGSDADATTTIADGASDPARAMYFKITSAGSLTATRTCTIAPNTVSRVMFIENATTGSQSIAISQGSGANVTIATGKTAVVYLDGAGSGAAVVDAMAGVDPGVTDTLTEVLVAGNTSGGTNIELSTTDKVQFRDTGIYINSSVDGQLDIVADTEIQIAATTVDVNGNLDVSGTTVSAGKITADAGIDIDNINIDGTTIALSSGDLTLDVAGDINLDSDSGYVLFKDAGVEHARIFQNNSGDVNISSQISDKDMKFLGNDGGVGFTALTLDMSDAGAATFNGHGTFNDTVTINSTSNNALVIAGANGGLNFTGGSNRVYFTSYRALEGAPDGSTLSVGEGFTTIRLSNAVVANEAGADADFRVESNDNANMLFVDGTNNRVGIGKTPTTHPLEVAGTTTILPSSDGDALIVGKSGGSNLYFYSNASASLITNASGAGAARDGFQITSGNVLTEIDTVAKLSVSATNVVVNDSGANTDFRVESDNQTHMLHVDASADAVYVKTGSIFNSSALSVGGTIGFNGQTAATYNDSIGWIDFTDASNLLRLHSGGDAGESSALEISTNLNGAQSDAITVDSGGVIIINQDSADRDFRVESNGNANMLFVDANNNRIGVGTGAPSYEFVVSKDGTSGIEFGPEGINSTTSFIQFYNRDSAAYDTARLYGNNYEFYLGAATVGLTLSTSTLVVNESGADSDFRVESDNTSAALFVDGANGKVVLGGTTANADLYITKITAGEVVRADNSQASWSGVMYYSVIFGTGNNNGSTSADRHFQGYAGGAARFIVCGNGDVKNNNNSYGAISDLKLKENIVDSGSQWDDIKALRIRKYSMKDEYSDVPTQIGVIAQELEAAGMGGLVTEGADLDVDNNDLGTTTKQVTYSVLYMKAVKALQEAMERIESLESRVAALES
jgi:hypothetical protein